MIEGPVVDKVAKREPGQNTSGCWALIFKHRLAHGDMMRGTTGKKAQLEPTMLVLFET